MKKIKEAIVVEGKSDVVVLSKLINADFIITNGLGMTQKEIDLIKIANQKKGVILFLDPDSPGEKIRRLICQQVTPVKHAFIDTKKAKKGKKVGIAEADANDLLEALENLITFDESNPHLIKMDDLFQLKLTGSPLALQNRKIIQSQLHLGQGSAKTFLKRINMMNISIEELKKMIANIHHMNLCDSPFQMIKSKTKDIEMRLNDEKRSKVKIDDFIIFTNLSNSQIIVCQVTNIFPFASFKELYDTLPHNRIGYLDQTGKYEDMYEYYTQEKINKYGVLGIEIKLF